MKHSYTLLSIITIGLIALISFSCGKRDAEREIQRFKDAPHDPQIVGTWYCYGNVLDLRSDGQSLGRRNEYYYTENSFFYLLWPGGFLQKNQITRYLYRIQNDTLHLMGDQWTKTPPTPSSHEN